MPIKNLWIVAVVLLTVFVGLHMNMANTTVLPDPALDENVNVEQKPVTETVTLAGGCFWGIQGVYQHMKGVTQAVSGYAGGDASTAHYQTVSTGTTGHAESVQVTYDPKQVTLGQILKVYFSVAHDPTELNYQGPDHGTQYRSTIFYATAEQQTIANAYIAQLDKAKVFSSPIVTTLEPFKGFYPAEAYHQDYLRLHPDDAYIRYNDLPKIADLRKDYPTLYQP